MIAQRVFAQIADEKVVNISVGEDYEMANWVTRQCYGDEAFAVECTQYPCGVGDAYRDGTFYRGEEIIEYVPTAEEEVEILRSKMEVQETMMIPMQAAARMAAFAFTDAQALTVPDLYPLWSSLPDDTTLTAQEEAVKGTEITRVRDDDGRLHKVTTTHKKQADWAPGIETASLFTVIADPDIGTKDKPIVWVSGMESESG